MKQFSIPLGKFFGIPTTIHWTFWILIIWIVYRGLAQGDNRSEILWYVLFVFTIFVCVVLHELGHALAARRYKINTRSITILPIGGVASLESMPEEPSKELVVAIAGPLVNVAIAIILWMFLTITGQWLSDVEQFQEMTSIHAGNFLFGLFAVNILLVVFNMIPAFPMDGGRILRALLSFKLDRVRATEWAVNIGKVFAILFVFWGFSNNPFLIFIALFIFLSAQAELNQVRSAHLLGDHTVGKIMMQEYTTLQASQSLQSAVDVLLNGQETSFLVLNDNNEVAGLLTKIDIIRGLSEKGAYTSIQEVMKGEVQWLNPKMSLQEANEVMLSTGISIAAVGAKGHLQGVLDADNLQEFLLVQSALSATKITT
ncbi:MAG: site-2 protease family protein [Saprospiraceae bacterium]|nr:site-2 protease family protein [Saprospiraceae bacterium]